MRLGSTTRIDPENGLSLAIYAHPEFDAHETVLFGYDADTGLRAIIAVHSTHLGPSLGGCRMFPYADEGEALTDVLRLARGMSYKAALAELPQGGGKSVIIGDPRADKTPALMRAMGRLVARAAGSYVVAEDSGIDVADIRTMAEETTHVSGLAAEGAPGDGDPSPATALGTFLAMQVAAERALGARDLAGVGVAIQGAGRVGTALAHLLHDAGARLWLSDTHAPSAEACAAATGAEVVAPDVIYDAPADIFSPCALGAVLNATTIPRLRARAVVGAANNQLATADDDARLLGAGVLYAPDYIVNAGGIIDIHYHRQPRYDADAARRHLEAIPRTLGQVLDVAHAQARPPGAVADALAQARIGRG
jgi:leucine dehydrogenase